MQTKSTPLFASRLKFLPLVALLAVSACTCSGSGPLTYGGDDPNCDDQLLDGLIDGVVSSLVHDHSADHDRNRDFTPGDYRMDRHKQDQAPAPKRADGVDSIPAHQLITEIV
jgi:hypothetical protein